MGNINKTRAIHESNFTVVHNEILFKEINNKKVPLEALGLFFRLMSLPKYWDLSYNGLASISGCSKDRIERLVHILEYFGYVKKKQIQKQWMYHIVEVTDSELWQDEEETYINFENESKGNLYDKNYPENKDIKKERPEIEYPENQYPEIEYPENQAYINNINNKINTKSNIIINKTSKNLEEEIAPQFINNNIDSVLEIKENNEQKNARKSRPRQGKGENFNASLKNKAQQKEEMEKVSIDNLIERKIGDNTEIDNQEARINKTAALVKEQVKTLNMRDGRKKAVKHRMKDKVDGLCMDNELKELFRTYISMIVEIKNKMTNETFDAQVDKLYSLSSDLEVQKSIIKQSIEKGYCDLYPISKNYKPETISIKPQPVVMEGDEYELARDENGNVYQF